MVIYLQMMDFKCLMKLIFIAKPLCARHCDRGGGEWNLSNWTVKSLVRVRESVAHPFLYLFKRMSLIIY